MSNRRAQDERIEGTPDGVNAISEIVDVPDAPTIGTATASIKSASVAFTPATTGGTVSTFTATSSPGSFTGTSATSPITVSGLAAGTSYSFTVRGANSTGTSPESSSSNSVTALDLPGSYDALTSISLSSSATSVTLEGIPQNYKHLQVRAIVRSTTGGTAQDEVQLTMNSDTGSNYAYHFIYGNGGSAVASVGTTQSYIRSSFAPRSSATANSFGALTIDILDYANTSKNKTIRSLAGGDLNNTEGLIALCSGLWLNTNAITSLTFKPESGNSFPQYSSFALYGVK